jgi:hypothetical protein
MKFLEQMHKWERGIEYWMTDHPWKSTLYAITLLTICLCTMHYSVVLAFMPVLVFGVVSIFIMFCSTLYLVRLGYQPERCDKCGHVLPEKRP